MLATVIRAPAGLGKTHAFSARVARSNRITEIYVPTNQLAEEWRTSIHHFNPSKRVQLIRGRSATRQVQVRAGSKKMLLWPGAVGNTVTMCMKAAMAEEVTRAGQAIFPNLCRQSQGQGLAPVACQHYEHCDYIAQFKLAEVYIYTHAYLGLERGQLENWVAADVIIDETFFQSLIEKITFDISLLSHPSIPGAAASLCADVAKALMRGKSLQRRLFEAAGTSELKATIKALNIPPALSPSHSAAQQRAALKQTVSFKSVRMLIEQLAIETQIRQVLQAVQCDSSTGKVTLHRRLAVTRFDGQNGRQPSINIIDASASPAVIEPFFEIERFESLDVPRNARVIQCTSTRCSTTSLVPAKNTNPVSTAAAKSRLLEITSLVNQLAANGGKGLVVGPAAVVGNPKAGQASLIPVPTQCELAHFNAVRGVDRWKDCDFAVIIGRNEPPIGDVENMARALYFDDPEPLEFANDWAYAVRGYRVAGATTGVHTAIHPDQRIQAVLEQLRECESQQAVDRLRLVHCLAEKTVILLSNVPLDIDVHELRTWDELMNGTRLERAWAASPGVLPMNPHWLAANHPTLWTTAEAAKSDVRREIKKGRFPNIFSIKKVTLFAHRYRLQAKGKWSLVLAASNDAGLVEEMLKAVVGPAVRVRRAPCPP